MKHYETDERIELDFTPTPRGEYLVTELGYCGEVPEKDRSELERVGVLFFRRHECSQTVADKGDSTSTLSGAPDKTERT